MPPDHADRTRRAGRQLRHGLGVIRGLPRRVRWAIEDRRLVIEQGRGILGPAHLGWTGNSTAENRGTWTRWDWSHAGEEWTPSEEWKQSLIDDVLWRWIAPGGDVLEIGPGGGRWSEALASRSSRLVLVDISQVPLERCRERLRGATNVEYLLTEGTELAGVADQSIDAVWSFDVFVHIAPADQAAYLNELARVLRGGGMAVIHHADGRNRGLQPSRHGWRAPMSRGLFAALAAERGLDVESQLDSWGPDGRYDLRGYADAITVCRRRRPA
jgi:SAM-dependent methyltransferase